MDIWFCSDHHFQHANILNFKDKYGCLIRPDFDDVNQMNEAMIDNHNSVVKDGDNVWMLGDVTWKHNLEGYDLIRRLKGNKYLTVGNHDDIPWLAKSGLFKGIYYWRKFPDHNILASHVPLNSMDMERGYSSVHGHIHEKVYYDAAGKDDLRYFNVSMEAIGYTPINIDTIAMLLPQYNRVTPDPTLVNKTYEPNKPNVPPVDSP